MAKVIVALPMSLDGCLAGPDDGNKFPLGEGGAALLEWHSPPALPAGTPSRHYERFRLSGPSAQVFDAGISSTGAVVAGRRTYDIANRWNGEGPVPGLPLLVLTHDAPAPVPKASVPYTFATGGIESSIKQARAAAGRKYVSLMGSQAPHSACAPDCSTRSMSRWFRCCWGGEVACSTTSAGRCR